MITSITAPISGPRRREPKKDAINTQPCFAERIYGREAGVVYPPVDVERFRPNGKSPENFFLLVGGFVSYKREDLVVDALQGVYDLVRPSGGFYVFPKIPSKYASATAFAEECVKRNLLVIAGNVFSERDTHFRISYAAPDESLRRGCEVLRDLAG